MKDSRYRICQYRCLSHSEQQSEDSNLPFNCCTDIHDRHANKTYFYGSPIVTIWNDRNKRVGRMCTSCCNPWTPCPIPHTRRWAINFSVQKYLWSFFVIANECSFAFLKVSQTWCNHFRMGKYQSLNVYEIVLSSADYRWWYVFIQMPSKKACFIPELQQNTTGSFHCQQSTSHLPMVYK